MKNFAVSVVTVLILTGFSQIAFAQDYSTPQYSGSVIGLGLGFYSMTTWWYWYNPGDSPSSHYPIHVYSRQVLSAYFERRGLFNLGPVSTAARGEFQFGFLGGSKEDWLPLGETISDGGLTYSLAAMMKFAYPVALSGNRSVSAIAPFAGLGVQYIIINSNGEGVGEDFASRAAYDYASGWADFIFSVPMSLGIDFDLSKYVLTFEYRFNLSGSASTDWEPVGYAPDGTDMGFDTIILTAGLKL
jgi:hypothetical protein